MNQNGSSSKQTEKQPGFLASEYPPSAPADALFHIIPVPLEKTVSYGEGTANGPNAIVAASQELEAFDGVSHPGEAGIYTAPPVDCTGNMPSALEKIEAAARSVFEQQKIPILLGGEHTLTYAAIQAAKSAMQNKTTIASGGSFGVVQIDAHADLRDTYRGDPFSHACVMRRISEMEIPIFQIGVRNICTEEITYRAETGIGYLDADALARDGIPETLLPEDFPQNIYLTFDVDGLDASLMPATGTPEPGGLFWWQALTAVQHVLRRGRKGRKLIGMDIVELAPIANMHAPDYTAAKLTYTLMGYASRCE